MEEAWLCLSNLVRTHSRGVCRSSVNLGKGRTKLTARSVLTTPEDLKHFHSDSALHKKSPSSNGGWFFHQLLGDCMGLINDHHWQAIRGQFNGAFTHLSITRSWSFLLSSTKSYLQHFAADVVELQPVTHFASFPFFATAEYLYGPLTQSERDELWGLGQRNLALMGCVLMGGVYRSQMCRWRNPEDYRRLKTFEDDWVNFNETIVEARKDIDGPLSPVVEGWKAVDNGTVTRKEVRIASTAKCSLLSKLISSR